MRTIRQFWCGLQSRHQWKLDATQHAVCARCGYRVPDITFDLPEDE